MKQNRAGRRLRLLIPVLVLAIAACQRAVETHGPTPAPVTPVQSATAVALAPSGELTATQERKSSIENSVMRFGWLVDINSDKTFCGNPQGQNTNPTAKTRPSLYTVALPGFNVVPDLAISTVPPEPLLDGGTWVVEVALREDAVWSDGHPITADDMAFTFDLHAGLPWTLGGCFGEEVGVVDVEAVDPHVVRIIFSAEPGLAVWPHGIGMAEIMAEHFWGPHLVAAEAAGRTLAEAIDDPAAAVWEEQQEAAIWAGDEYTWTVDDITTEEIDTFLFQVERREVARVLKEVSGIGEPSGGPMVFADWKPGLSVRFEANSNYHRSGEVITSGGVTYTVGPFVEAQEFITYGSAQETLLALLEGEIDYVPLPEMPFLRVLLDKDPAIITQTTSMNAFWYLGLNLRKPPMNDLAFRRALATMIDRDFLSDEMMQGFIPPAWTLLPEANLEWFDEEAAAEITAKYRNLDRFERLEKALEILEEAGYTWDRKPRVGLDERGKPSIEAGSGIRMPNGTTAPDLELINYNPSTGWSWFTSHTVYIEHWLKELGFSAETRISSGHYLVERVWPGVGVEPTFDMVFIGWMAGDPAFPVFYESWFHSRNLAEVNDGNNAVGYINPELDALADGLYEVKSVDEARRIIWQIEKLIDRDLPYIVLLNTINPEAYRTRVEFPFTETLGGIGWNPDLFQALVRIRE